MRLPRLLLDINPFNAPYYLAAVSGLADRGEYEQGSGMREVVARALSMGVRGLHCMAKGSEIQVVKEMREQFGEDFRLVVTLPDPFEAIGRFIGGRNVSHGTHLRMALRNLPNLASLALGDLMPSLGKMLEEELRLVEPLKPDIVVLHHMLTDLGCAYQRKEVLHLFYGAVEGIGAVPGVSTHHLGAAYDALVAMDCVPPVLMCPVNPKGYMMSPSAQRCLEIFRGGLQATVLAKEAQAGGTLAPEEAVSYALSQVGVAAVGVSFSSDAEAWAALTRLQRLHKDFLEADVEVASRVTERR